MTLMRPPAHPAHGLDLGRAEAPLLDAVAHVLLPDSIPSASQRNPARFNLSKLVLHGVHARVRPDVELVTALDDGSQIPRTDCG